MARIIVDAGPVIALLNRKDTWHSWAEEQVVILEGPLWTCDAVLTEISYLIPRDSATRRRLQSLLSNNLIISDFASKTSLSHVFDLMETYKNVPMSFADACLVCMVEQSPGAEVFTLDRDFTIYRQHRRRLIPLIAPFSA